MEKIILTSIDKTNQDLDMYTIAEWIANVRIDPWLMRG